MGCTSSSESTPAPKAAPRKAATVTAAATPPPATPQPAAQSPKQPEPDPEPEERQEEQQQQQQQQQPQQPQDPSPESSGSGAQPGNPEQRVAGAGTPETAALREQDVTVAAAAAATDADPTPAAAGNAAVEERQNEEEGGTEKVEEKKAHAAQVAAEVEAKAAEDAAAAAAAEEARIGREAEEAARRAQQAEDEARRRDEAAAAAAEQESASAAAKRAEDTMLAAMLHSQEQEIAAAELAADQAAAAAAQKKQRMSASTSASPVCASPPPPQSSPSPISSPPLSASPPREHVDLHAPATPEHTSVPPSDLASSLRTPSVPTSVSPPPSPPPEVATHISVSPSPSPAPASPTQAGTTAIERPHPEAPALPAGADADLEEAVRRGREAAGRRHVEHSTSLRGRAMENNETHRRPQVDATAHELDLLTRTVQEELATSGTISLKTRQDLKRSQGLLSLLSSFTSDDAESLALSNDSIAELEDSFISPPPQPAAAPPAPFRLALSPSLRCAIREALEESDGDDPQPSAATPPPPQLQVEAPSPTYTGSLSPERASQPPQRRVGLGRRTQEAPAPQEPAAATALLANPAAERLARLAGARTRSPRGPRTSTASTATQRVVTDIDAYARMMGQCLPPAPAGGFVDQDDVDDTKDSDNEAAPPMPRLASPAPTALRSTSGGSPVEPSAGSTADGCPGRTRRSLLDDDSDEEGVPQPSDASMTPKPTRQTAPSSPTVSVTPSEQRQLTLPSPMLDAAPEPAVSTPVPSAKGTSIGERSPTLTVASESAAPTSPSTPRGGTGLSRLARMMRPDEKKKATAAAAPRSPRRGQVPDGTGVGGRPSFEPATTAPKPHPQDRFAPGLPSGSPDSMSVSGTFETVSAHPLRSSVESDTARAAMANASGGGGLGAIVRGTVLDLSGVSLPLSNPTGALVNVVCAMRPVLTEFRGAHASPWVCPEAATAEVLNILSGGKGGVAKNLEVLDLTGWCVGSGAALVNFVKGKTSPKLRSIVLGGDDVGAGTLAELFGVLPATQVKHVSLSGCTVTAEGVTGMLRGMRAMNMTLEQLDLSNTSLPAAAIPTLGMMLRKCKRLTHLSLAGNPLYQEGSDLLATMLLTSTVKVLVLHECRLVPSALKRVTARGNTVVSREMASGRPFPPASATKITLYSDDLPVTPAAPQPAAPGTAKAGGRSVSPGTGREISALRKVMKAY